MADVKKIANAGKFIESFDRIFLSYTALKNPALADYLVKYLLSLNLKPRSIILNRQTYTTLQSSGILSNLKPLQEKGLLLDKVFAMDYISAVRGLYEKGKRYKILLITLDEKEGTAFEELDVSDNHINDIDAIGFEINGNFYQYQYRLPSKDIVFKVKPNVNVDSLKVIFYKTEINGSYTPLYPKNDPRSIAKKSAGVFSYAIDINELFESDKVMFVATIGGKEVSSDYNDFFFGEVQAWFLNIVADRISAHNNKQEFDEEIKTEQTTKQVDVDSETVSETEKYVYYGDLKKPKPITLPADTPLKTVLKFDNYQAITGTKLKTDRGQIVTVGKFLGKGGEGFVYLSSQPDMVVKLFNDTCRTRNKKEKIEFMSKKRITHPCIAWPQDSLYDSAGNFVGYQMMSAAGPKGKGDLEKMIKNQDYMNNVTKTELVQAIQSICKTMEYLHQRNIVICDIKLENFVVKESDYQKHDYSKIVFVDCDSYQIDKFPCTVFTEGYLAPEVPPQFIPKVYRTLEYDRYSLFVLIFRILFRRKLPHSRIRGEHEPEQTFDEAAKAGLFPYFMTDNGKTESLAPLSGGCSMLWSHLPKYVKQALIDAGDKKTGKNFQPINRKHAGEWERIFRCYLNDLKTGKLKADKDCNVGYPTKKIDYSVVDIDMIREIQERLAKVSLRSAVKVASTKASGGKAPTEDMINLMLKEVTNKGSYKGKDLEIKLRKYLGTYAEIEYTYQG